MIKLTRLKGSELIVNSDLIEHMEVTPDTVITLTTGEKIVVLEPVDEIINKVIEFKRKIFQDIEIVKPTSGVAECKRPGQEEP